MLSVWLKIQAPAKQQPLLAGKVNDLENKNLEATNVSKSGIDRLHNKANDLENKDLQTTNVSKTGIDKFAW